MFLKRRPPLDQDEWEWQLAAFQWLLRQFGGIGTHRDRILARPDGDEFPDTTAKGHLLAEELLGHVKVIAGIADWPTLLVPLDQAPGNHTVNGVAAVSGGRGAVGTFRLGKTAEGLAIAEIQYAPEDVERPTALVGTLAHEVAHYLLHSVPFHGPGGEDCEELLTDLMAIMLGFGIFLGNHARYAGHFANEQGQWYAWGSRGYLSERARMSALAVSETLAGRDPMAAAPYLKPYLADDLRRAYRYISKRDLINDIEAIDLADYGA